MERGPALLLGRIWSCVCRHADPSCAQPPVLKMPAAQRPMILVEAPKTNGQPPD